MSNVLEGKADSGFEKVQAEVSEPAQHTRSQDDMTGSEGTPLSKQATDDDEIDGPREQNKGTASMDKSKVSAMGKKVNFLSLVCKDDFLTT